MHHNIIKNEDTFTNVKSGDLLIATDGEILIVDTIEIQKVKQGTSTIISGTILVVGSSKESDGSEINDSNEIADYVGKYVTYRSKYYYSKFEHILQLSNQIL